MILKERNSCEKVRLDEKKKKDYIRQDFIISNHSCLQSSIANISSMHLARVLKNRFTRVLRNYTIGFYQHCFLSDDINVTIIIIRLIKSRWHFMDEKIIKKKKSWYWWNRYNTIRYNIDLLKTWRKGKLQNFRLFLILELIKNDEIVNIMNTCFFKFQFNGF